MYKSLLPLLFSLLFCSCFGNGSTPAALGSSDYHFKPGFRTDSVKISTYEQESFALYLPQSYTTAKPLAVMICLDPHFAGRIPVQRYQQLADNYQVIVVGSNNIGNGIAFEAANQYFEHIMGYLKNNLAVDTQNILLFGFSGGAKMAFSIAATHEYIHKLVYSGAVMPVQLNQALIALGLIGNKDMNYAELLDFALNFKQGQLTNRALVWNGKHEWPDSATANAAFQLLQSAASLPPPIVLTDKLIKQLNIEQQTHQTYLTHFQQTDLTYWDSQIATLIKQQQTDSSGLADRLLGFISLVSYSYTQQAIRQQQWSLVKYYLAIYEKADPTNADCAYFNALYAAHLNDKIAWKNHLLKAIKFGFTDRKKIEQELLFGSFKGSVEWQQILEALAK